MNEKQVMTSFFRVYWGIWAFFNMAFLLTINENYFFFNTLSNTALILVVSLLPIFLIFFGLRELKENGIRIDRKTLKNVKLIPMMAGFVLMTIGIGFSAISQPTIYSDGTPTGLFWHPFGLQGLVIFFAGTGIQLLEMVWYYDTVSSKIVKEAKLP